MAGALVASTAAAPSADAGGASSAGSCFTRFRSATRCSASRISSSTFVALSFAFFSASSSSAGVRLRLRLLSRRRLLLADSPSS